MTVVQNGCVKAPQTKLPYYDLQKHSPEEQMKLTSQFHDARIEFSPTLSSIPDILQGFATFVSAITDLPEVAFVANYPVDGASQRLLAIASAPGIDKPRDFSSENISISTFTSDELDSNQFDFEIQIRPEREQNTAVQDQRSAKPFRITIQQSSNESLADLHLSLGSDHGPSVVAFHLLQLAARYLAPPDARSGIDVPPAQWQELQMSRMNCPAVSQRPPFLKTDRLIGQDGTAVPVDHPAFLHGGFERRAADFPDRIAIEYVADETYEVQKWTYAQLNSDAEKFADELSLLAQELPWTPGFKDQKIVPMFIPASPYFYIAVNAILKAGLALTSLPLDAPPQRLLDIVQDASAALVLGVGKTPFSGINLDDDSDATRALKELVWVDVTDPSSWRANKQLSEETIAAVKRRHLSEEDLAFVMYTSGSTGMPKGVLISHSMATCAVNGHAEAFEPLPVGPELRWLQFGMPTFDLSLLEIFLTLGYGGTLCIAERQLMLSNLEDTINFFKANSIFIVASLVTLLRPERLPTLQTIISGGEALTQYAIKNFSYNASYAPDVWPKRVINIYGPTETTMCATAEIAGSGSRGSIAGEVFTCASFVLVDAADSKGLREVPLGLTGEIVFGGPMVGYGYMNRPTETAQAYTSGLGLGPLYRTGDKGRIVWDPQGRPKLEILGRLNMEQVKINSRRVELGEIESSIAAVETIREVACAVVDGSFLVAYIIDEKTLTGVMGHENEIIAQCKSVAEHNLPAWMRPAQYVVVPRIPRTSSGKIDRKTLQKVAVQQFSAASTTNGAVKGDLIQDAPSSDSVLNFSNVQSIQDMVQSIAQSILGGIAAVQDVNLPLNAHGLDSLRAMRFLQELRRQGVEGLALKDVLAGNTIADVAETIFETHAAAATVMATLGNGTVADDEIMVDIQDEEEFLTLPLNAKLKHFDAACRPMAVKALAIPSEQIVEVLPTTGVQTRMLVGLEESKELNVDKAWVEHYPYKVPDNLDADRLEKAIIQAMNGRDAFRTLWVQVDHPLAAFAQCVLSPDCPQATLPVVRIECPTYDESPNSLWRQTVDNAQRSAEEIFGLHRLGSVTTFVRSADKKHCVVIFSLYHVIYDGMSLQSLSRDIVQAYHGLAPLPGANKHGIRVPVEHHFQSDWLATGLFWMNRLAGVPRYKIGSRALPASPSPFESVDTGVSLASESLISSFSAAELFAQTKTQNLFTPMSVIQAAWAMTLAQTMVNNVGSKTTYDITFASVFHGRQTADSLDAFALMLDGLPTRVVFSDDKPITHRQICTDLFNQYTGMLGFTEMPCTSVQFARSTRRFDSSIILQAFPIAEDEVDRKGFPAFSRQHDRLTPWKETSADTPILVELWPGEDRVRDKLHIRCSYSRVWPGYEFLTPEWVRGLISTFEEALVKVLGHPEGVFEPAGGL